MQLEFVKDLPDYISDYHYSDDIRDCCDKPIKCSHRIKQYTYPSGEFIVDRIEKCVETSMPLTEKELNVCFREWMRNTYPATPINLHLPELYELITKMFGKKKEAKGWVGIRMNSFYEDDFYEDDDYEVRSTTMKSIHEDIKPCILCEHGKCNKLRCKDCVRISQLCEHGKYNKSFCKICDGSKLCRSSWCHTTGNQKYEGYCVPCFINNPENILKPAMRNHKTKEKEVVDCVMQHYPQFTWIADRRVQDGCSRRRPDLLLDMGSHILIVEIDENKHSGYDCSCENKRIMEISQDLQHRPIVLIRFNPDSYRDQVGILVNSCWQLNKIGVMSIIASKRSEWNTRLETLNQQIQYWIDNATEKMVEIVELFY
jgi:hypothetical protein